MQRNKYSIGRNGTKCTIQDIQKATAAMNNLSEPASIGMGILAIKNGMDKTIKWGCAAEHIKKNKTTEKDDQPKKKDK